MVRLTCRMAGLRQRTHAQMAGFPKEEMADFRKAKRTEWSGSLQEWLVADAQDAFDFGLEQLAAAEAKRTAGCLGAPAVADSSPQPQPRPASATATRRTPGHWKQSERQSQTVGAANCKFAQATAGVSSAARQQPAAMSASAAMPEKTPAVADNRDPGKAVRTQRHCLYSWRRGDEPRGPRERSRTPRRVAMESPRQGKPRGSRRTRSDL